MERLGRSCADVISETFPMEVNPTVVVICGKDLKGAIGYHTAVELSRKEYTVTMLECEPNRWAEPDKPSAPPRPPRGRGRSQPHVAGDELGS